MAAQTTILKAIRQAIAKKLYSPSYPIVSLTTGAGTPTSIVDTVLAAASQSEDFVRAWVYCPTATYGTPVTTVEALDSSETGVAVNDGISVTAGDYVMVEGEIMLVTNKVANALLVTRGVLGSIAVAHATNLSLRQLVTTSVAVSGTLGPTARVTNTSFSGSSSSLTTAPAFAAALGVNTEYELHYKFHPRAVRDKVNEILQNMRRDVWLPFAGSITDGDMETSGVADWVTLGAATREKITAGESVVFGRQSLRVNNALATQYAENTSALRIAPGTDIFVAALVQINGGSGDAVLELFDATNAESVETATLGNVYRGPALLAFTATVPATASQLRVRLVGTSDDNVIDWNFVVVLPVEDKLFTYPPTLEYAEDFDEVMYLPFGNEITVGNSDQAYRLFEGTFQKWGEAQPVTDQTAINAFRLQLLSGKQIDRVLFVKGLVDFPTLSAESDATACPDDILVDLATADLIDDWAQEEREAGRIEVAAAKEARANTLRVRIGPRFRHFRSDRGRVVGTLRESGRW